MPRRYPNPELINYGNRLAGLGWTFYPLATPGHGRRLDRYLVLFYLAGPEPAAAPAIGAGCRRRVLECPRRRFLPRTKVHGCTRTAARRAALVQVRSLFHLAVRLCTDGGHVLLRRRNFPHRYTPCRYLGTDRGNYQSRLPRRRLAGLRSALPITDRQAHGPARPGSICSDRTGRLGPKPALQ